VGKTFQFPVLDGQSGALESARIEVLGQEDLMVPAGSYSAYKVKVKLTEGDSIHYCRVEAPHILIKQEMPAQGLSIELKALK